MKLSTNDSLGVSAVGITEVDCALKLETRVNTEVGFDPPQARGGPYETIPTCGNQGTMGTMGSDEQ